MFLFYFMAFNKYLEYKKKFLISLTKGMHFYYERKYGCEEGGIAKNKLIEILNIYKLQLRGDCLSSVQNKC